MRADAAAGKDPQGIKMRERIEERAEARAEARAATFRELAAELSALEWIENHTPTLESDPVARREIQGRLAETSRLLQREVDQALGGGATATWWYRGDELTVEGSRHLSQVLSGISPLVAAKYQIVVMTMLFGASGISAALYLVLANRSARS